MFCLLTSMISELIFCCSITASDAVGSSSSSTFEPHMIARATATAWRCPPERSPQRACTSSILIPSESSTVPASVAIEGQSSTRSRPIGPRRRLSRPRKTFSATDSSVASARSW